MVIEFDPVKDKANHRKHGVPLSAAEELFQGAYEEFLDDRFDYGEERWFVIGQIKGKFFACAYTPRGEARRIISLRLATKNEVRRLLRSQ